MIIDGEFEKKMGLGPYTEKQGKTMLIVTHEMQFAKAVADRVIFLDGGHIVEEGKPQEFFENPKTERAKQFLNVFSFDDYMKDGEGI